MRDETEDDQDLLDEGDPQDAEPEITEELPQPQSGFDQVVDEVLAGKWGSGQERRLRLSEAGINHAAVQKEVVRRINKR